LLLIATLNGVANEIEVAIRARAVAAINYGYYRRAAKS
jgi:exopolysaccharide biosynthesis protein